MGVRLAGALHESRLAEIWLRVAPVFPVGGQTETGCLGDGLWAGGWSGHECDQRDHLLQRPHLANG